MPFVLPQQIAHGVSMEEADKLNATLGELLPASNIIPPIPMKGMPGKYAVLAFVQDKAYLPPKESMSYPEDGPLDFPENEEKIVKELVEIIKDVVSRIKDQVIAEKDKPRWIKPAWIEESEELRAYRRCVLHKSENEWKLLTGNQLVYGQSLGKKAIEYFSDSIVVYLAERCHDDTELEREIRYRIKDERAGDRFMHLYHKKHIKAVQKHSSALHAFAQELPTRCSFDPRLVLCIPTDRVLEYTDELRVIGRVSKHHRTRSVRLDDEGIVATFLDMRYVNPINYDDAIVLEDLFRGKHVLSQYLYVMPGQDMVAYDEDLDPYFCPMIKLPWFEGTIVGKRLTEEERRAIKEAGTLQVLSTPGSEVWDCVREKVGEKDGESVYAHTIAFFHLGDTEFAHLPSISDAVVYGKLQELLALPSIKEKESAQVASARKVLTRVDLL